MAADGTVERGEVAGVERVEDGLVLCLFGFEAPAPGGGTALDPGDEKADADAAIGFLQQRVAGEADQGVVELAVQRDVVAVGQVGTAGEPGVDGVKRGQRCGAGLRVGQAAEGQLAGHELEGKADGPELGHMVG